MKRLEAWFWAVSMIVFCGAFFHSFPVFADGSVGVNWSTPWGGSWMTPGTCGADGNILQVSGSNCTVVNSTNVVLPGTLTATAGNVVLATTTFAYQNRTLAQISASTPSYVGAPVWCTNCAAAGGKGTLCISTTTVSPGAGNDFVLSTGTVCI